MRRLQRKHLQAILSALDADIVVRMEAARDDFGRRREEEEPIDAEVPAMKEAESIIKERLGL
jgi:hypothetical protein